MAASHESTVYDVKDCKIYVLSADSSGASAPTYGAAVDVPGIAELSVTPNITSAELKGDATIIARSGRVDMINVEATYGKLSLDVIDVLMAGDQGQGASVVDTGSDPSSEAEFTQLGSNSLPYFKLEALVNDLGDLSLAEAIVTIYKCQITDATFLGQSSDEYGQPSFSASGIRLESSDKLWSVKYLQAAAGLSA